MIRIYRMLSVFVLIAMQVAVLSRCSLFVPDAQNPSATSGACKKFVPLQIETVVDRIFE